MTDCADPARRGRDPADLSRAPARARARRRLHGLGRGRARAYLDLVAGLAVCSLGHGHPAPAAALSAQAFRLGHVSNLFWSEPSIALAERLHTLAGFGRVFFCNSGAEALEAGIKLARRRGGERGGAGKHEIVALERAFHGRTLAHARGRRQRCQARPLRAGARRASGTCPRTTSTRCAPPSGRRPPPC